VIGDSLSFSASGPEDDIAMPLIVRGYNPDSIMTVMVTWASSSSRNAQDLMDLEQNTELLLAFICLVSSKF